LPKISGLSVNSGERLMSRVRNPVCGTFTLHCARYARNASKPTLKSGATEVRPRILVILVRSYKKCPTSCSDSTVDRILGSGFSGTKDALSATIIQRQETRREVRRAGECRGECRHITDAGDVTRECARIPSSFP